jgi:dTMP kinase
MLVVLEGIDGAGGETQSKRLERYLKKRGIRVLRMSYPDRTSPVGRAIYSYLEKESEKIDAHVLTLLFLADFKKDVEDIKSFEGVVICDRYWISTLVYQQVQGVPREFILSLISKLELPQPDLIVYIDISPETSIRRKSKEKRLDAFERNVEFLRRVRETYLKEVGRMKNAVIVDGEKGVEEVFREIVKVVDELLALTL